MCEVDNSIIRRTVQVGRDGSVWVSDGSRGSPVPRRRRGTASRRVFGGGGSQLVSFLVHSDYERSVSDETVIYVRGGSRPLRQTRGFRVLFE